MCHELLNISGIADNILVAFLKKLHGAHDETVDKVLKNMQESQPQDE